MKTTISSKGRIVLPAKFRRLDRIEPGEKFEVERIGIGEYRLIRRTGSPNAGFIDWLLACPHKDYFVAIESEESTGDC